MIILVCTFLLAAMLGVALERWQTWRRRAIAMRTAARLATDMIGTLLEAYDREGRVTFNEVPRVPSDN